jgi:hypothetical protein
MSIGATTRHQQAPAVVHHKPVRGELVLAGADPRETTGASHAPRHAAGHGTCSDTGFASFAAIDMPSIALRRRGLNAESP